MREKVILQDFTVLLVCPSSKWSTIERRVLFDSTFLRNIGCNPVLLCVKNSQLDIAAEAEDIPRIYVNRKKISLYLGARFILEFRKLILENRFDIVHCYSLSATWMASFVLKSYQHIPLFFTLNQSIGSLNHNFIAKWLMKRVDFIFTLSGELRDYAEEVFPIHPGKIQVIGSGLEVFKDKEEVKSKKLKNLGCVINSLNELKRLKYIVKVFRVLKSHSENKFNELQLHVFLGPKIYQKNKAKKILTELDYEFYEGDVLLYNLSGKSELLKDLDIFIGTAFDEPMNDFEIVSIMNEIPVLFPRTAMRQSLLFKHSWIGESFFDGDIREAKTKLSKILNNYAIYQAGLSECAEEITLTHGLETYAGELQRFYEKAFVKRRRFQAAESKD